MAEPSPSTLVPIFSSKRFCDGFLNRPPAFQPAHETLMTKTNTFSPLSQTESFSVKGNVLILSGVSILNVSRSPSTVRRFIVAVIIDAVNRMFGRGTMTHISQEINESVLAAPSIANHNAAPAVAIVSPVRGVVTSPPHSQPRFVFRHVFERISVLVSMAVTLSYNLFSQVRDLLQQGYVLIRASEVRVTQPRLAYILPQFFAKGDKINV